MIWLLLLIALILIFGLGSVLEAALWVLFLFAAVVIVLAIVTGRALRR
jgi:hypothetical protein